MTANQISYQIGSENVNEARRHNLADEAIRQQLADLEESKLRFQDEWKKRDQYIQEDYNKAYLEYLNSGLNETEAHDRATEDIANAKNDNDRYYSILMGEIQKEANAITEKRDSETKRHNQMMEQWNEASNWIKTKELEYQQSATLLQASKDEALLAFNQYKANLDAEMQNSKILMDAQIAKTQMELDKYKADLQAEMGRTHEYSSIGQTIVSGILHLAGRR